MVGRLVEQHDIGLGHQHARQCRAARLAARQLGRRATAVELHLVEHRLDPVVGVALTTVVQGRGDVVRHAGMAGEIRLLRQGGDRGAGLDEARAAVGDRLAGQDAQQGRLAGAVAADQRQPLARRDRRDRRRPGSVWPPRWKRMPASARRGGSAMNAERSLWPKLSTGASA